MPIFNSHFVRNDNQWFMFLDGGRLAASPPTYHHPLQRGCNICHSERSEESTVFRQTTVIIYLYPLTLLVRFMFSKTI